MEQNIIQLMYAVVSLFIVILLFIAYCTWRIRRGINNLLNEFKEYNEEEPIDQEKIERQKQFERLRQEFESQRVGA